MSAQERPESTAQRRLRSVPRPADAPDAASTPRVEALDTLLREVDDLRLALETDLTLAASALECGHPEMALEILDQDSAALGRFEQRALAELASLDSASRRSHWWARVPATPFVAAAALVGLLLGAVPQLHGAHGDLTTHAVAASESLERLQASAASGDAADVRAASQALHLQLADALANAGTDPAAAQNALMLLTYEQSAIVRSGDSGSLGDVLAQSRALAKAIVAALPRTVHVVAPVNADVAVEPSTSPSPTAKPKASSSPSPKASAKASSSPSASPSSSPSDANPLPSPFKAP